MTTDSVGDSTLEALKISNNDVLKTLKSQYVLAFAHNRLGVRKNNQLNHRNGWMVLFMAGSLIFGILFWICISYIIMRDEHI